MNTYKDTDSKAMFLLIKFKEESTIGFYFRRGGTQDLGFEPYLHELIELYDIQARDWKNISTKELLGYISRVHPEETTLLEVMKNRAIIYKRGKAN